MSLLNGILEQGAALAKNKGPDWVDKLAAKMETTSFQPAVDPFAKAGAAHLVNNKTLISDWTGEALLAAATYVSMGEENEARKLWIRQTASLDDLLDTMDANAMRTQQAIAKREKMWADVKQFLKDFLRIAGPIALQLLLVSL